MSIGSYFQPENGIPDPKGSLSCSLLSQAIALANKEVEKVIGRTKKCGVQRTEYSHVVGIPLALQNLSKTRIP